MIRTFIATKIDATLELQRLLDELRQLGGGVKPVREDNLHVTLKFLGETDERLVPGIAEILRRAVTTESASEVLLHGLGAFPHAGRPSVIWVGLQFAEPLTALANRLDRDLIPLGFEPQRQPLQLHLTVARVKAKPPRELGTLLEQRAVADYGTAWVRNVEFMQSELLAEGARYTSLALAAFV